MNLSEAEAAIMEMASTAANAIGGSATKARLTTGVKGERTLTVTILIQDAGQTRPDAEPPQQATLFTMPDPDRHPN